MRKATEKEKMLSGQLYYAEDPELKSERIACRVLCQRYNQSHATAEDERQSILRELFRAETNACIEPSFRCDYGWNIRLGDGVFINFNCVILDVLSVVIGDRVLIGPSVQIYTATHPLDARERASGLESGKPVTIGSDVWIGGGAIVCPGVTIGDRTVIGAGSVVTKDLPSDVICAGNPARVIREMAG